MARVADHGDHTLAHYGIPGMKWGKRRAKTKTEAKVTKTPYPKRDKPVQGVTDLSPKPIRKISDVELRNRINRIQMETQYKQLTEGKTAPTKSKAGEAYAKFEKGHKVVKQVMAVGKTAQSIHKIATSDLVKDISKLLK